MPTQNGSLKRDDNDYPVMGGTSSSDNATIINSAFDPITRRLLTDAAGGSGTVTSVSVVSANGLAGTVATTTTTPAITLSTTVTAPVLAGNGTAIAAATTTGTGSTVVLQTSPSLITPALGTPSSGVATNLTGTASGLTAGTVTTNANLTGPITSSGNATSVASQTGTGSTFVMNTSPTISNPTVGTQATTDNSTLAASTAYVTTAVANAIAAVNPAMAVQVATTTAGNTSGLTYVHVAGVGDTFTGIANTAITIDGHTLVLGDRVLVKNDTQTTPGSVAAGTFNGIYVVTTIQALAVAPVLTRALDYDTPSDVNNTGAIPVILGTANASTSWLLTSSVTAIGTGSNALTYTQFSYAPSAIPTLAGTNTFTGQNTFPQVILTANAITATSNAATIPVTSGRNIVTNNSAATLTITLTTSGAVNMQTCVVQILDFSAVAQTLTWVNTENSTASVPTTSNGSTILPLSVGFMYNSATSKWRCLTGGV